MTDPVTAGRANGATPARGAGPCAHHLGVGLWHLGRHVAMLLCQAAGRAVVGPNATDDAIRQLTFVGSWASLAVSCPRTACERGTLSRSRHGGLGDRHHVEDAVHRAVAEQVEAMTHGFGVGLARRGGNGRGARPASKRCLAGLGCPRSACSGGPVRRGTRRRARRGGHVAAQPALARGVRALGIPVALVAQNGADARSSPRLLTLLPTGEVLNERDKSKVRRQERGHEAVERRLCALGAMAPRAGQPGSGLAGPGPRRGRPRRPPPRRQLPLRLGHRRPGPPPAHPRRRTAQPYPKGVDS